jgi:hypothetical protein
VLPQFKANGRGVFPGHFYFRIPTGPLSLEFVLVLHHPSTGNLEAPGEAKIKAKGTDAHLWRCSLMSDQAHPFEEIARPFIEQCRREIGAAWTQVEAAREGLRRTRGLLAVWEEQRRMGDAYWSGRPDLSSRSEAARIGMFVSVAPEPGMRAARPHYAVVSNTALRRPGNRPHRSASA